jgi:hypothetical protein
LDLASALNPIAAALLPGWVVTCEELPAEEMDRLIPGSLAICEPLPTRSLAHVRVLSPWPDNESIIETLWHELTHAAISPITSQIDATPGAVMIEEQIVERLGNLLAKIPLAARLAVARAIQTFAPAQMRARLSTASAGRRARTGEAMDPETIQKMIDALKAGDGESALKMCEEALVKAASGGAAPAPEPDGDELPGSAELPKPGEGEPPMIDPKAKPAAAGASPAGPETPAEPAARTAARRAAFDAEHLRARKAADATVGTAVRARLREIRQDGVTLPTNIEASLAKMVDLDAFELRVSDLLEGRKLASPGAARARAVEPTQVRAANTPAPTDDHEDGVAVVDDAALKAEGFDDNFVNMYKGAAAHSKKNAEALLSGARARRASHRAASKGAAS